MEPAWRIVAVGLLYAGFNLAPHAVDATQLQPSVPEIFALYKARDFAAVDRALARVVDWEAFAKAASGLLPAAPRELGAGFVLEAGAHAAAVAAYNTHARPHRYAKMLIEAGCERLRRSPAADAFELRWHLASLAVLHGTGHELPIPMFALGGTEHRNHVQKRFPTAPQIQFGLAIFEEQQVLSWLPVQGVEVANPTSHDRATAPKAAQTAMRSVAARYKSLTGDPGVGLESQLRLAVMTLLVGDAARAVEMLETIPRLSSDPWLSYLAHFFRGQALTALRRAPDSIAAYREALAVLPGTQSAQLSLAALLHVDNQRDEAAALVRAVVASPAADGDPWMTYPYGEFRRLRQRIQEMRELLR